MGVVNVTPDSFSDGGRWATPDAAIAHGRDLLADGRRHPRHRWRVDPARRHPAAGRGGARPGRPGDPRPGRRRRRGLGRHHALRGRRAGAGRRRHDRQRRLRRPGRPADPRRGRRARTRRTSACTGAATATACSDLAAYDGPGGVVAAVRDELCERVDAARAAGIARRADRARPRARASPRRPSTTGRCCAGLPVLQSLGLPAAGRRQPQVVPRVAARRPRRDAAAGRRPRGRHDRAHGARWPSSGVWGLRVHDVRASRDALRARLEQAGPDGPDRASEATA